MGGGCQLCCNAEGHMAKRTAFVCKGSSNLVTVGSLQPVHCCPGPLQPSFSASSQAPQPQVHALSITSFSCGPSAVYPGSHHLPALSPSLTSFPSFPPLRHTHTVPTSLRPDLCLFSSECAVTSVMSNSLPPYGLQPTRLLCPWDSAGKNTGVDFRSLLQGIFPTQGLNPHLLWLLHYRWILYH